jgi:hypothetical protein
MEDKLLTLQKIYDLVKNNSHPALCSLHPSELIARQTFPWDEVVSHLLELQDEGLVSLRQFSTAAISITEEGLHYMSLIPAKFLDSLS